MTTSAHIKLTRISLVPHSESNSFLRCRRTLGIAKQQNEMHRRSEGVGVA